MRIAFCRLVMLQMPHLLPAELPKKQCQNRMSSAATTDYAESMRIFSREIRSLIIYNVQKKEAPHAQKTFCSTAYPGEENIKSFRRKFIDQNFASTRKYAGHKSYGSKSFIVYGFIRTTNNEQQSTKTGCKIVHSFSLTINDQQPTINDPIF